MAVNEELAKFECSEREVCRKERDERAKRLQMPMEKYDSGDRPLARLSNRIRRPSKKGRTLREIERWTEARWRAVCRPAAKIRWTTACPAVRWGTTAPALAKSPLLGPGRPAGLDLRAPECPGRSQSSPGTLRGCCALRLSHRAGPRALRFRLCAISLRTCNESSNSGGRPDLIGLLRRKRLTCTGPKWRISD